MLVLGVTDSWMDFMASAESGDGSLSVGTGYAHEGVEDLIWAADHMGYESPADLQKTGVLVIRFILVALGGITEQECNLGFETAFNPYGPHRWVTEWAADDLEALEWVADHYCISPAQAQAFGGTLFAFFAGWMRVEMVRRLFGVTRRRIRRNKRFRVGLRGWWQLRAMLRWR